MNQLLPSNSLTHIEDGDIKTSSKIIKGSVKMKEKPILMRLFGESARAVGFSILWDILIPSAKDIISEIIDNTKEIVLYGEDRSYRTKNIRRNRDRSYVSYNSIYDDRRKEKRSAVKTIQSRHKFDDVVFESRPDAEEVLSNLVDLVDQYGVATVSDFYTAAGLESAWADNKWGWDNLSSSEVKRDREGYVLVLPKPEQLTD